MACCAFSPDRSMAADCPVYKKHCKTHEPRHGEGLLSPRVPPPRHPRHLAFRMIRAGVSCFDSRFISFDVFFFFLFLFCMTLHSCLVLGTVPRYASSLWVDDNREECSCLGVFTCTFVFWS